VINGFLSFVLFWRPKAPCTVSFACAMYQPPFHTLTYPSFSILSSIACNFPLWSRAFVGRLGFGRGLVVGWSVGRSVVLFAWSLPVFVCYLLSCLDIDSLVLTLL